MSQARAGRRLIWTLFFVALALVGSAFAAQAAAAQLVSDPQEVEFASRPVSTTSPPATVTIVNSGSGPVRVGSLSALSGPFALAFDRCSGTTLPPGHGCQVGVRFSPGPVAGEQTGTLEVSSDDPASPLLVPLSGVTVSQERPFPSLTWWSEQPGGGLTIARARTDGTGVTRALIEPENPLAGGDTAQSAQGILWTGRLATGRAEHGDAGPQATSFMSTSGSHIAVSSQHIFLAGDTSIARAGLDGSGLDLDFIPAVLPAGVFGGITGLGVGGDRLFWAVAGGDPAQGQVGYAIGRANLDGSGVEQTFIGNPMPPNCLNQGAFNVCSIGDVAVTDEHVYWAWSVRSVVNGFSSGIGRANLDGSAVDPTWLIRGDQPGAGGATVSGPLAADSDWLYFTTDGTGGAGASGIARIGLDGSGLDLGFIVDPNVRGGLSVSPPGAGVLDVSPEDGARRAAPGASPSVTFSEPLDPASVASAFTLTNTSTGQSVAGRVESQGAAGYRFVPAAALSAGATYRATVSTAARSADDGTPLANPVTWTFTVDDLRPDVDFVYPQAGSVATSDAPVVVAFDQDMAAAATQQAFSLTGPGGAAISGSFAWYGPRVLVFFPSQPLAAGGPYTARVSTAARSTAGLPLDAAHSSSFTVLDPVRVVGVWPEDGATGVSPSTPVVALFNSNMDFLAISLVRTSDGEPVPRTEQLWNGRAALILPDAPLEPNTSYTARVEGATDVLNRRLSEPRSWTFTTGDAGTAPQAASSLTLSAPPAEGPQPRALAARQRALRDAPPAVRRLLDPDTLLRLDPRLDGLEKRVKKLTARRAGKGR